MWQQLFPDWKQYLEEQKQPLIDLIAQLTAIPAPSHKEQARARFILEWFHENGVKDAYLDSADNVICPIGVGEKDKLVAVLAHTDTVFPDETPIPITIKDDRMYAPGVGDDTANVAMLMLCARYLANATHKPDIGLLLVADAGEEGLGNLKGVRQICHDFGDRINQFVALDGGYTSYCNKAVGSTRYQVELFTEGGHSYGDFGNRNAIHLLSSMIDTLYTYQVPKDGAKSSYNVGTISGGTSVNTIAQYAKMLFEYRSDAAQSLAQMNEFFAKVIESYRAMGVKVEVTLLGERPCMGQVDADRQRALEDKALSIIEACAGTKAEPFSGSTDCNIPFSMGIPSICFGGYLGHGAHTREEYIELNSLPAGIEIILKLLIGYYA